MTIRYTCTSCGAVLKIKDEKAGTQGRCPKCKAEFLIPAADGVEAGDGAEADNGAESVDMPLELTPAVPDSSEFDPADVLSGPTPRPAFTAAAAATTDRKPSVAELMRDFESTKKKDRKEKSAPEISRPAASSVEQTSGSAADLISRAYQQKRETSSTPVLRPDEIKAAEQKELLRQFLITRALPVAAGVILLISGYLKWMNQGPAYEGPPLFEVTGTITRGGVPAPGVTIQFEPVAGDTGLEDRRTSASGTTGTNGEYTLAINAALQGAAAGEYNVQLFAADGLPVGTSAGEPKVTVRDNGENVFDYELK
jgi:DNA-directed RNA polymerase subunit RPC12/RpoP